MHIGNRLIALTGLAILGCASPDPSSTVGKTTPSPASKDLTVTSSDFQPGAPIPDKFSSYFENVTPSIHWTAGPSGTKSYVLVLEDPDAPGGKPFVHWLVTNIPPKTLSEPGEGITGNNTNGKAAYYGPHPPEGPTHRYQFQVLALDMATVKSQDRDGLKHELLGHVLAVGILEGLYEKK